jgi:hypothetical protein
MYDSKIITQLKQTNVSVDAEKTKARVAEAWKNASKDDKAVVATLAGVNQSSIVRAYKTGNISAKLIVPFAQTLNVNPFYLTGEKDEFGESSAELLKEFLLSLGYGSLTTKNTSAKRKYERRTKNDVKSVVAKSAELIQEVEASVEPVVANAEISIDEGAQTLADTLSNDEAVLLLQSVLLKAKAGGKYAELATKIKTLLLS